MNFTLGRKWITRLVAASLLAGTMVTAVPAQAHSSVESMPLSVAQGTGKAIVGIAGLTPLSPDQLSRALPAIRTGLDRGRIVVHLDGAHLDAGSAHGFRDKNGKSVVQIPLRGERLEQPSNLSVFFDARNVVSSVVEVQYAQDQRNAERGRVTLWRDNSVLIDKVVTAEGGVSTATSPRAGLSTGSEAVAGVTFDWGKFNDCLASHGIAGWLIVAIGVACSVACAGTLGAGCAVCLASIGGIGTGVITNCYKKATS